MKKPRTWLSYLLKPFLWLYIKIVFNPKFINSDYIPKAGPVITAGNHRRLIIEAMMVGMATNRTVYFLSKKEHFEGIKRHFFGNVGCIPVDRGNHDEMAKETVIHLLKQNKLVNIFPEGTRNKTDELLLPLKYGVVSFANKTNAVIVPFAIKSSFKKFKYDTVVEFAKPWQGSGDLEVDNERLRNDILSILKNK